MLTRCKDMVSENDKKLINYFYKLAKKKKIVYAKDVLRAEDTPKEIRSIMLNGNISSKLSQYYAYNKGMFCRTTLLGSVKQKLVIVFLKNNEKYVNEKMIIHNKLLKKHKRLLDEVKKIEFEMLQNVDRTE